MSAPFDVFGVLGELNLADPAQRPAFNAARSAIVQLLNAARGASILLETSKQRESGPAIRLRAALAKFGGAA